MRTQRVFLTRNQGNETSPRRREFDRKFQAGLLFGETGPADPGSKNVGANKSSVKNLSLFQKIWHRVLLISPVANLMSGLCLVSSHFMPDAPKAPATVFGAQGSGVNAQADPLQGLDIEAQKAFDTDWASLKKTLNQLGWTLMSVGSMTGSINGLSLGLVSKQPSMALCSLISMSMAPLLLVDPSITVRSAMIFFAAPWLSGMGNKLNNEFNLKPGELPREREMAPLFRLKALREKIIRQHPEKAKSPLTFRDWLGAWTTEAGETLKFVLDDQVLMLKNVGGAMGHLASSPSQLKAEARKNLEETLAFLKNQRKELPDFLKPSATQNHVGAMLIYLGSVPMLFLGGPESMVTEVCTKLTAAGGGVSDISLFMTALQQRDKMLLVGIPLRNIGSAWMHTDLGTGATLVGRTMVQQYFVKQVQEKSSGQPAPAASASSSLPPPERPAG